MGNLPFCKDVFGNEIYMPERTKVFEHKDALHKILLAIAPIHCGSSDRYEQWTEGVFLTDLSSISDFSPDGDDLTRISDELGIEIDERMPLHELAALLSARSTLNNLAVIHFPESEARNGTEHAKGSSRRNGKGPLA